MTTAIHLCRSDPLGWACLATILPWIVALGIVIATGIIAWRWSRLRKAGASTSFHQEKVLGAGNTVAADLLVEVGGPRVVGKSFPLSTTRTIIGRDPELADIRLYDSATTSTVSGRHCTIDYDADRDQFLLVDDGSTNGTVVNGRQLQPSISHPLHHDDVILLGDPGRNGARLRFVAPGRVSIKKRPLRRRPHSAVGGEKTVVDGPLSREHLAGRKTPLDEKSGGLETLYDRLDEQPNPDDPAGELSAGLPFDSLPPGEREKGSGPETIADLSRPDVEMAGEPGPAGAGSSLSGQVVGEQGRRIEERQNDGESEDEDAWLDYL